MGKVTGFLEFEREDRDYQPVAERIRHWHEFVLPLPEKDLREQAARCMNCGVPYCHGTNTITGAPTGCPVNNQIPDWNDLVYSRQLGRGGAQSALHQQFSGSDRPGLPGAMRGVLHAQHRRQSGHHQDHRMRDRRSRHQERLDQAGTLRGQDRQEGRGGGLRPRRHGLRPAARARRPRRASLREARQGRRPDALRHSRFQDGEARRRHPRRADGGRRRDLPLRRPCRRRPARPKSCSRTTTRWR